MNPDVCCSKIMTVHCTKNNYHAVKMQVVNVLVVTSEINCIHLGFWLLYILLSLLAILHVCCLARLILTFLCLFSACLGDFLLLLPVCSSLGNLHPASPSPITWVVFRQHEHAPAAGAGVAPWGTSSSLSYLWPPLCFNPWHTSCQSYR